MKDAAIILENLTKIYRMWDSPAARVIAPIKYKLTQLLPRSNWRDQVRARIAGSYHDFHALKDISLEIRKGESFGIIGRNGAGKSTLLQMIAGTLSPTSGRLEVNGRVAALLELGSGFNPDFTGRENVYLSAAILGLTKEETDNKFDDIVAFADIAEFLEQPVKTYSSGMMVRLAFAVQTAVEPDILIVDEALSVGDSLFQAKCMVRLKRMLDNGLTLLFVTHGVDIVPQLCQRAVYLEKGRTKLLGSATEVVDSYLRDVRTELYSTGLKQSVNGNDFRETLKEVQSEVVFRRDPKFETRVAHYRYGTGRVKITAIETLRTNQEPSSYFYFREKIVVRAHIEMLEAMDALNCCMLIRNSNGVEIMHCTSREYGIKFPCFAAGKKVVVDISFENILKPGSGYSIYYSVNNTYSLENQEVCDAVEIGAVFDVVRDPENPIWYLVWHPFEFEYRAPETTAENALSSVISG